MSIENVFILSFVACQNCPIDVKLEIVTPDTVRYNTESVETL